MGGTDQGERSDYRLMGLQEDRSAGGVRGFINRAFAMAVITTFALFPPAQIVSSEPVTVNSRC